MHRRALRGREHTILGGYAAFAEGHTAIAGSMGGAPKRYPHTDPNEDVTGFARGEGGVLIAVADGHGGHQAAEIAMDELLRHAASLWTGATAPDFDAEWTEAARDLLWNIHRAILTASPATAASTSRTTLVAALVRPGDEQLAYLSVGDSHLFHVSDSEVVDLGFSADSPSCFLGRASLTRAELDRGCVADCERLGDTRAVLVATDGFSEVGIGVDHPEAEIAEIHTRALDAPPSQRALTIARELIDRSLASHRHRKAGDNVACGVVWLGTDSDLTG